MSRGFVMWSHKKSLLEELCVLDGLEEENFSCWNEIEENHGY
jgi:hypothetical protein